MVDLNNEATELYDLNEDPAQENNLISEEGYREEVERLHRKFLKYKDHEKDTVEPRTSRAYKVK